MDKEEKLVKEVVTKYYEDIDEDVKRRIRVEKEIINYIRGAKNFPTKSYHTEII